MHISEYFLLCNLIIFTNGLICKQYFNVVAHQGGADFNYKCFPFNL